MNAREKGRLTTHTMPIKTAAKVHQLPLHLCNITTNIYRQFLNNSTARKHILILCTQYDGLQRILVNNYNQFYNLFNYK